MLVDRRRREREMVHEDEAVGEPRGGNSGRENVATA